MKRTLSLYVVSEILPPFLFGLLAFTFMLLIVRILRLVELVVTRGVPLLEMAKLFGLILPTFLEMTIPMALLFGIFLGLTRLSNDQEILALKATGISPTQLLLPIGIIALVVSSLTLLLTTSLRPAANLALKKELYNLGKSHIETALKAKVFNDDFPGVLIYMEEIVPPGNTSQGVLIVDRRNLGRETVIIGKVALFLPDEEAKTMSLKLFDGTVHERGKTRSGFSQTHFNVYDFKLDLVEAFSPTKRKEREPKEMSLPRLMKTMRLKEEQGLKVTEELIEFHQRFAFAFAPIILSILALSLVMVPTRSRTSRPWGLTLCLTWLLVYYGLLSLGKALGEREILPAFFALWIPNIVLGITAIHLFRKALTESPLFVQTQLKNLSLYLNSKLINYKQKIP